MKYPKTRHIRLATNVYITALRKNFAKLLFFSAERAKIAGKMKWTTSTWKVYSIKKALPKTGSQALYYGDSAATRTQNLLLRRQLLYPVELRNRLFLLSAVGIARFELATSCSQSRRDNRTTLYPVSSEGKSTLFFHYIRTTPLFLKQGYQIAECQMIV